MTNLWGRSRREHTFRLEARLRPPYGRLWKPWRRGSKAELPYLAAQLPAEIGRHLTGDATFQRLSIDEFFRRVHQREGEGIDLPDSVFHARVVIEVLEEAVSKGAVDKIRVQLPAEFAPLFEAGSQGRMRLAEAKDQKGSGAGPS